MKFNKNDLKSIIIYGFGIGIVAFIFVFLITCSYIGTSVKDHCKTAQQKYEGDCVEALSASLEDSQNDFRTRNDAIWSLGELGDRRALPVLEKYYTGNIPEREPLNNGLSQYELKKAIKLIESGVNLSAFVWR